MPHVAPSDLRERIYQVAMSQFREHGFGNTAVSKVTREVGIAKGTFFNHFPTKDHVLAESLHRRIEEALFTVQDRGLTGTGAIFLFVDELATSLAQDPLVAKALVIRLSELPGAPGPDSRGALRDEERIRTWLEARLAETLPRSVPLVPVDSERLAFFVTWTIRGTLEEWVRERGEEGALKGSLQERIRYLLESSGLPAGV